MIFINFSGTPLYLEFQYNVTH